MNKKKKKKKKRRRRRRRRRRRGRATLLPRRGGKKGARPRKSKKEKKKKKKATLGQKKKKKLKATHVYMHMGIFVNQENIHLYSVFSPFWRENILVGTGRKHLNLTIYFSFFLSNQTHSKKVLFSIFSLKFSIYPISLSNKHTLRR